MKEDKQEQPKEEAVLQQDTYNKLGKLITGFNVIIFLTFILFFGTIAYVVIDILNSNKKQGNASKFVIKVQKPTWEDNISNPIRQANKNIHFEQKEFIGVDAEIKTQPKMTGYACTLSEKYNSLLKKEIVYFEKQKLNSYSPIFKNSSWNKKGFIVKKRFFIEEIDKENGMLKTKNDLWVPLYDFSSCMLVEEIE